MTLTGVLLVAGASAAGAAARYVLDALVSDRAGGVLPWGTLAVNASGSLLAGGVLGLVLHAGWSTDARVVVSYGFLGSFTTFSTFAFETVHLALDGSGGGALLNAAANVGLSVAAAALGLAAAVLLTA